VRIVLSGTAVAGGYDEPRSMRNYLVDHGVDSLRLRLDRAGTSSAASIANLGPPAGRLAVVSQRWHLARLCWLAGQSGWKVRGLAAGLEGSPNWANVLREHFVRAENFWERIFHRAAAQVVSFQSER
jgi:vancomycin permeability regulator SanA